jgi:hypothetical protein
MTDRRWTPSSSSASARGRPEVCRLLRSRWPGGQCYDSKNIL